MNARTALGAALVAVLLTGCAAGQEPDSSAAAAPGTSSPTPSAAPSAAPSTTPTSTPTSTPSAVPPPAPEVRTVEVAYAGGEVTGTSGREEVPLGEDVVLRIASDVAEEVHVHGYDVYGEIPAGGSVDIPLTADIPGVFEVELHDSGEVLFQLRVA